MMRVNGEIRLSASDLMRFMGCAHATALDLSWMDRGEPAPIADTEDPKLVQRHGDAHEARHLPTLQASRQVVEIDQDDQAAARTRAALAAGTEVVLERGPWAGWADFLERVERPSALGAFSYEVADTKLKPAPSHLLQLVLYSDLPPAL